MNEPRQNSPKEIESISIAQSQEIKHRYGKAKKKMFPVNFMLHKDMELSDAYKSYAEETECMDEDGSDYGIRLHDPENGLVCFTFGVNSFFDAIISYQDDSDISTLLIVTGMPNELGGADHYVREINLELDGKKPAELTMKEIEELFEAIIKAEGEQVANDGISGTEKSHGALSTWVDYKSPDTIEGARLMTEFVEKLEQLCQPAIAKDALGKTATGFATSS